MREQTATLDTAEIPLVRLPAPLRSELERLAMAAYPHEACGVLIGNVEAAAARIEGVTRARNLNVDRPADRYELDPDDFVLADRLARDSELEVVGFWHSHPDHPARPSRTDLEAAWPGYSYFIVPTTAGGAGPLRSWRLGGAGFYEQTVRQEDTP